MRRMLTPLSWLYGLGVGLRNRRYDAGRGVVRLPVPVVSVGNITVGGSGKTPFVAALARGIGEAYLDATVELDEVRALLTSALNDADQLARENDTAGLISRAILGS